jgi:hypothetical protein
MQNVPFHLDDVIVVAVRPNPPTINLKETLCQRLFILLRECDMSEKRVEDKLQDGTLIRHKVAGYEGRIEGTTEIKSCFTVRGELLGNPTTKLLFQYRVVIKGNPCPGLRQPKILKS